MKRFALAFLLVLVSTLCFSAYPANVYSLGYEVVSEVTANVTTVESVVTPGVTVNATFHYVEFIPQATGTSGLWFDSQPVTGSVVVWKPIGSSMSSYDNMRKLSVGGNTTRKKFGLQGVSLKKDSGSAIVGIIFYKRARLIQ